MNSPVHCATIVANIQHYYRVILRQPQIRFDRTRTPHEYLLSFHNDRSCTCDGCLPGCASITFGTSETLLLNLILCGLVAIMAPSGSFHPAIHAMMERYHYVKPSRGLFRRITGAAVASTLAALPWI